MAEKGIVLTEEQKRKRRGRSIALALVLAALVILFMLLKAWRISALPGCGDAGDLEGFECSVGFAIGYWIALVGAIIFAAGGYMLYSEDKGEGFGGTVENGVSRQERSESLNRSAVWIDADVLDVGPLLEQGHEVASVATPHIENR